VLLAYYQTTLGAFVRGFPVRVVGHLRQRFLFDELACSGSYDMTMGGVRRFTASFIIDKANSLMKILRLCNFPELY
jgi:hypothetical protein